MANSQKAKAYLKVGCPFSFKFLVFMTEAGLLHQIEIVSVRADDSGLEQLKAKLEQATGAKASFPTVEIEPGVYRSDSDQLIQYYADRHGIAAGRLPVLDIYKEGVFSDFIRLYKENMELKAKLGG